MKKLISFIVIILILIISLLYSTYGKEFFSVLDEKKIYRIDNIETKEINTLDEFNYFNRGIITYNNQKILYMNFNNELLWEKDYTEFSNKVFIEENYIFRQAASNISLLDKNGQQFIIPEIYGDIVNVSRENKKTSMVVNENGQRLYIMDENNKILLDGKKFNNIITAISISDKSEAYAVTSLNINNGVPLNTLYYNLLEDVELWNVTIENEIVIKTQIINNNVIVLGTENIYFYNSNGSLMWKNSIYNKILDYYISNENQRIYLLLKKSNNMELISYNFDGKVMELHNVANTVTNLKLIDNKLMVYNKNSIYYIHGNKIDKIFDHKEGFKDFIVEGNNINILFKNKIIKGQIK